MKIWPNMLLLLFWHVFHYLFLLLVCCSAKLSTVAGLTLVWRVSRMEKTPLGREVHNMRIYRTYVSSILCVLPNCPKKPIRPVHQKALHKVYLPHCILLDFPVSAASGITAYRHNWSKKTRTSTNHCGVDDSALGFR